MRRTSAWRAPRERRWWKARFHLKLNNGFRVECSPTDTVSLSRNGAAALTSIGESEWQQLLIDMMNLAVNNVPINQRG